MEFMPAPSRQGPHDIEAVRMIADECKLHGEFLANFVIPDYSPRRREERKGRNLAESSIEWEAHGVVSTLKFLPLRSSR